MSLVPFWQTWTELFHYAYISCHFQTCYSRDLSDLNVTFPNTTVDWTPEAGYPPNAAPDALPRRPRGAGSHLGFTIVLDAELQEFHCSTTASVGFKVRAAAFTECWFDFSL
jgi:hypothetical protein